jgi:hypothetical protein
MPADLTPIEELDQNILTLCTRINAATYELLVMIREFDERAGWLQWGLDNCAEWLAWRCDLSMTTAREKVRVAHALKLLPLIAQAFSSGELSYSKVKAMTRVANRENEQQLLEFALRHTAVTVELPLDTGELLEKALDKARDDEVLEIPDIVDTSWSVRQADAFVNVLNGYLSGQTGRNSDNYLVTIHVDESALTGGNGRAAVPLEAVKRHCCDGHAVVITETSDGDPLGIGRRSRLVPKAIERAVRARDNNGCVFPGCNKHRFLDCHHVEHWAHGGETAVDNLVLLCTKHHTLVHEGGFSIRKDFLDNWAFFRRDGIAVPDVGYVSSLDENPPAGGLLSMVESSVKEPPPPQYLH